MEHTPVMIPEGQEDQVRELYSMMQPGTATLIGADGRRHALPETVYKLLLDVLQLMKEGGAVSLVPVNQQLTTQSAANILGVSRPFLIKLLQQGEVPFHKVGTHRRIYLRDLLEYQKRRDKQRRVALRRMARQAHEDGIYDAGGIPEGGSDE